jgi:hypothetical protein
VSIVPLDVVLPIAPIAPPPMSPATATTMHVGAASD